MKKTVINCIASTLVRTYTTILPFFCDSLFFTPFNVTIGGVQENSSLFLLNYTRNLPKIGIFCKYTFVTQPTMVRRQRVCSHPPHSLYFVR